MLKRGFTNPRFFLPLLHGAIALALLSYLYLPQWPEWRKRDLKEQQYIEAEARAGRWPPADTVGFEPCYFGPPRLIAVMFPANLPALLVAGPLVVPSTARDRLLESAPGRILPTTRILIFIALFAMAVALQWYLIARLLNQARLDVLRWIIIYIVPVACVPFGLMLDNKWADILRLGSLPFWGLLTGAIWQGRRKCFPTQQELS